MRKFETADLHWGHKKVSELRGFSSPEKHDEYLIKRWNETVKPDDIVWVIGDYAWNKTSLDNIKGRLNGTKKLIMGNHDTYASSDYLDHFDKLHGSISHNGDIHTHIPVHPQCLGRRFEFCIHGHLHTNQIMLDGYTEGDRKGLIDPRYICVSVDQWDLAPVSMEKIEELKASRRALNFGGRAFNDYN